MTACLAHLHSRNHRGRQRSPCLVTASRCSATPYTLPQLQPKQSKQSKFVYQIKQCYDFKVTLLTRLFEYVSGFVCTLFILDTIFHAYSSISNYDVSLGGLSCFVLLGVNVRHLLEPFLLIWFYVLCRRAAQLWGGRRPHYAPSVIPPAFWVVRLFLLTAGP